MKTEARSIETQQRLTAALVRISNLAYIAWNVRPLDHETTPEFQAAVEAISAGIDGDEKFNSYVGELLGQIGTSGILAIPSRKITGVQGIMDLCRKIEGYLDRNYS